MKDEEGRFIGFNTPRFTQVPDDLFDELLPDLSGAETKCLLYIIRRTFGWKQNSDHISMSQLIGGIRKADGTVLDRGTGLSKDSVARATRSLMEKGILMRRRVYSDDKGCKPSNYSLRLYAAPLSDDRTEGPVLRIGQGVVRKSDTQETIKQDTVITFKKAVDNVIHTAPVDKSIRLKHEYIVGRIMTVCQDKQSLAFYRGLVRILPEQAIEEALSQVKDAARLGRIKTRPGAMFTDLIKRKAKELGIEFGQEHREPEAIQESHETSTPAEVMMAGRMGRR